MNTYNISNRNSKPVEPETVARMVVIANLMRNVLDCTRLVLLATGEENATRWEDQTLGRQPGGGPAAG